jgi:WD40 repeat protein
VFLQVIPGCVDFEVLGLFLATMYWATLVRTARPSSFMAIARIVSGSRDKSVRLWGSSTGEIKLLEGHTNSISSVAFSSDGRRIVSDFGQFGAGALSTLEAYTEPVESAALYTDGQFVSGPQDLGKYKIFIYLYQFVEYIR